MNLPQRLVAIHRKLEEAGVEHAFGGAIALAYWTLDPRGTSDIDVNVFMPAAECAVALDALPSGVAHGERDVAAIRRDGQARLWWDSTPVDVFFDYVELHAEAARNRRLVPFEGIEIPILGPVELAAFKAMFDRTRDWADIEAMLAAETLDPEAVEGHIRALVGAGDPRVSRLEEAVRRADAG